MKFIFSKEKSDPIPRENSQINKDQENRTTLSCDSGETDVKILTLNELNHLYAAVLRAELSGNTVSNIFIKLFLN